MARSQEMLVVLLDVGKEMQPYLPTAQRMLFSLLSSKLIHNPTHEVAIVLFGTEGTQHACEDESGELSYQHVTVLREMQAPSLDDVMRTLAPGEEEGGGRADGGGGHAFGPPGPKSDWLDGLLVSMDLLNQAFQARFAWSPAQLDQAVAFRGKKPAVRIVLLSNFLAQFEPLADDDPILRSIVETLQGLEAKLEVACLDLPDQLPPAAASSSAPSLEPPSSAPTPGDATQQGAAAAGGAAATAAAALYWSRSALSQGPLEQSDPPHKRASLDNLHLLRAELKESWFRHLRHPGELLLLFPQKDTAPSAAYTGPLTLAPGVEVKVKVYKKTMAEKIPAFKKYFDEVPAMAMAAHGGEDAAEGEEGGGTAGPSSTQQQRQLLQDREYRTMGGAGGDADASAPVGPESTVNAYRYGKELVPLSSLEERALAYRPDKGLMLLGFVPEGRVPRYMHAKDTHVIVGDGAQGAVAVSALAQALKARRAAGVVRCVLRASSAVFVGLMTPLTAPHAGLPDGLLLNALPFAEDIRLHSFSTFRTEQEAAELARASQQRQASQAAAVAAATSQRAGSGAAAAAAGAGASAAAAGAGSSSQFSASQQAALQPQLVFEKLQPTDEQQAAADALVRDMDLGGAASGWPEGLAPDHTANPMLARVYSFITAKALQPGAQLPEPDEGVEFVFEPQPALLRPAAGAARRQAEQALATSKAPEKRKRGAADGGGEGATQGAPGEGAEGAAAAHGDGEEGAKRARPVAAAVFDAGAAAGLTERVARVGEVTPVDDFKAMVADGRVEAALTQMMSLVPRLVSNSIGDQLYARAAQCCDALRAACVAEGRPADFNAFLRDLAASFYPDPDRQDFVLLVVGARALGLITPGECPPGAAAADVAASEQQAAEFRERFGKPPAAPAAPAPAAPVAAPADDEFADMD